MKQYKGKSPLDRAANQPTTENAKKSLDFNLMIFAFVNIFFIICLASVAKDSSMMLTMLIPVHAFIDLSLLAIGFWYGKFKIKTIGDIISFIIASPIASFIFLLVLVK